MSLRQLRECLLHVQLAHFARLELHARNAQAFLLGREVVIGDLDALLVGADVHVGAGDAGREADQGAVVGGHRGEHGRAVSLDAAAVLAPEVQLPAGAEAKLTRVQDGIQARRDEGRLRLPLVLHLAGHDLLLREQLTDLHL